MCDTAFENGRECGVAEGVASANTEAFDEGRAVGIQEGIDSMAQPTKDGMDNLFKILFTEYEGKDSAGGKEEKEPAGIPLGSIDEVFAALFPPPKKREVKVFNFKDLMDFISTENKCEVCKSCETPCKFSRTAE